MSDRMLPDQKLLDELVRRILSVVQAERIILFGSAARGEMGPDSDLDVLVVVPDGTDTLDITGQIYVGLIGFGTPTDVVAVTERELEFHRDNFSLVLYPAIREGREIYAA